MLKEINSVQDTAEKVVVKPLVVKRVQTAEGWRRSLVKHRKKQAQLEAN